MSLFGSSPEGPVKSSLFEDDKPAKGGARQGPASGGLFDGGNDEGDSPWGFSPRKQARGNPVKTLLAGSDVPDSYIDAFDALLESGERAGNGVSIAAVRRVLGGCGIGAEIQTNILRIVQQGQENGAGLGRAEFNVLVALIGLAQEGEEATLDGVDERKHRLPHPRLPQLRTPKPPPPPPQSEPRSRPEPVKQQPAPPSQSAPNQSYGFSDTDPWATSPPVSKQTPTAQFGDGGPANGLQATMVPQRTTSTFTTSVEDPSLSAAPPPPAASEPASEGWNTYNGASSEYSTAGGFGDPSDEPTPRASRPSRPHAGHVNRGVEEVVTVESLQEKEGMFLFQHRNYEVASSRRGSKVIRRYSDFVWLLDCLHKRYPFRQLPLLPPKRVAINGNHIAADTAFIEKRRRGLARFVNALVRHPVLSQEQLVVMFMTVPTELSVWRKQAAITVQEEFTGKTLPADLEGSLPADLEELFDTVRSGVRRSMEIYINLCTLLERLVKRKEGLAADYSRLSLSLQTLTETSSDTYKLDTNDVPLLNQGLTSSVKHISTHQNILLDEAQAWDEGVLEDFKRQRDGLVSMRDMFERRERGSRDTIPQLERRIAASESKLAGVRAKPEGLRKPGEAEKIEDSIVKDKESITAQHARGVFIKECLRDEIVTWQSSQYHVSRLHQDWSQDRVKYAELVADNWRGLSEEVEGMPVGES